jgi:hypothetical protein
MQEYNSLANAAKKYKGLSNKQLKTLFEIIKYKYNKYKKKNKCYNKTMYFIKKNLSKRNKQIVANLRDPQEI